MTEAVSTDLLLAPHTVDQVTTALGSGVMVGGWLITGAPHIGKARLALALAETILSGRNALGDADDQTRRLITNGAHPDLFILSRRVNEKTGRLRNDIVVDDVRQLIERLQRTSTTGRRVAIIDTADDLNREAANALLKVLEEPPAGTLMVLLSAAPGRLLPTVKSRCRRLAVTPVEEGALARWLAEQKGLDPQHATSIARLARGRPGRAVLLADGEGEKAQALSASLLDAALSGGDLIQSAQALGHRDADDAWTDAITITLGTVEDAIKAQAGGITDSLRPGFQRMNIGDLFGLHDQLTEMVSRADRLNSDRTHTALYVGLGLRQAMGGQHARR